MVYLTGDTHGDFERIEDFCHEYETVPEDVMVILGDAGINYWLDDRDKFLKEQLAQLPITLLCIHGNHEQRPEKLPGYVSQPWNGGTVWVQDAYPNLLFAEDGAIYNLEGRQAIAIGGAYSVDKDYRLAAGQPWFASEQPDERMQGRVMSALNRVGWRVDAVLSHTVPLFAIPQHALLPGIDQSTVDRSTEEWLEEIEEKLTYERWFAGHYHVDWSFERIHILYETYEEL